MKTYIYRRDRSSQRNVFWNTCGWTDRLASARFYSPGEAEPVVRRMIRDNVKAKTAHRYEQIIHNRNNN